MEILMLKKYGTKRNYGNIDHHLYGNMVSTGVYIYSLRAGDFIDTKKMVI